MNTTELVIEMRPEKNSGPLGIWTHDLCGPLPAVSSRSVLPSKLLPVVGDVIVSGNPFSFGPISLVISHSAMFLSIATPVEKGFIGFYGELVIQKAPAMASAFSLFNSIA